MHEAEQWKAATDMAMKVASLENVQSQIARMDPADVRAVFQKTQQIVNVARQLNGGETLPQVEVVDDYTDGKTHLLAIAPQKSAALDGVRKGIETAYRVPDAINSQQIMKDSTVSHKTDLGSVTISRQRGY